MTTKTRLSKETMDTVVEYVNSLPMHSGSSSRMDHEDCPAGRDSRMRLYIKVTNDSKLILAHCFNCGGSGVRGTSIHIKPSKAVQDRKDYYPYASAVRGYEMATVPSRRDWTDYTNESSTFHVWPFYLMEDCKEEFQDADFFGIRYDSEYVYIPRGENCGFDIRLRPSAEVDSTKRPKWNRVLNPDIENTSSLLIYNRHNSNVACIVEDPVSAMKVSLAGYAGVALCGSTLSTDDAFKIGMLFKKCVVWLDNDKEEIIKAAGTISHRIKLFVPDTFVEYHKHDPKLYTLDEIKRTIGYHTK